MVDSFECKKWTLFTLCLVGIVLTLVITIVPSVIIDYTEPYTEYDKQHLYISKGVIIGCGVGIIVVQLLGIFGAYFENFWLTFIYAIVMTVATFGSIALGITIGNVYWGSFVLNLIVTIVALLYARELYTVQNSFSPGK